MMPGARRLAALAIGLAGAAATGVAGCGDSSRPPMVLLVSAEWNSDPATADDVGYQVLVDLGWPSRPTDCFPLSPNLKVHVNDLEVTPLPDGDCEFDVLVRAGAFRQDTPVTVAIEDGGEQLGEARFTGLFPGFATHLVSPADGQEVHAGAPIVLSVPTQGYYLDLDFGEILWLDGPASVPPYSDYLSSCTLDADGQSCTVTGPTTTGHGALTLTTVSAGDYIAAQSCTGFQSCAELPEQMTLGPVFIDVVP
jgi:hypothetical protein